MEISVVLPVYNGQKYLRQSLDSVLSQSFSKYELLICDDGSIDNSVEIIESYKDPRILTFKNKENKGIFHTLNFLIRKSRSGVIHLWSQDDIMNLNCLEEVHKHHIRNPQAAFFFSHKNDIYESGIQAIEAKVLGADVFSRHLSYYYFAIYGCMPGSISTVSLKKDIFLKTGGFDEEMKYAGDFDMWVRICDYGPFGVIKGPLVNIRIHEGRASRQIHMAEYKLIDSQKIFKLLLSKVDKKDYKNAKISFDKLKMPYFFYSYLNLILKGHFQLARRYFSQLVQYENIFRIFADAAFYFIASKFGFLERYKEKLFQNLKSYYIKS